MLLLLFSDLGSPSDDTYFICSSVDPDVLDTYVDGVLIRRMTSA